MASSKTVVVPALAGWVAKESRLFADEQSPFAAHVTPGHPRLVLVAGANASGKSLFVRALAAKIREAGPLPVSVSIRERSGEGMRKMFMFGDEAEQSTGATSVDTVRKAFERNLDREGGTVLILDEPELGLSEGYAAAFGTYIGSQTLAAPPACSGVVVVTHSRTLAGAIAEQLGQAPTFAHMDADPVTFTQWVSSVEHRSVDDLLALPKTGHTRRVATYKLLDSGRR